MGGAWTPLQRAKNDLVWAIAAGALRLTPAIPIRVLRVLGRALGIAAYALAGGSRRTALTNVARVYPALDTLRRRKFVRRCFATLGELLGETVALLPGRDGGTLPALVVTAQTRALLDRVQAEGRGVVFASAHLGPWERVAASLVAAGIPLVTVARESYDPRFTRLYERLRNAGAVGTVWRGGPGAAARIMRILRSGGVLGVPMDLSSRVASCSAPFLGHAAPSPVGPARLALRMRAAVVVGTAAPSAHDVSQGEGSLVVTATRIPTGDLSRDDVGARELTARINRELSRRILAVPHAWPWMHDRWRGLPEV
jgi:KDO2-lipid IV(A) lauroyltransferase